MHTNGDKGHERRRARRYPAVELRARIRTRKGLFSEEWEDVTTGDFSRSGIAIDAEAELEPGSKVTIHLALHMEVGIIEIPRIVGEIKHRRQTGKLFHYGVEFQLEDKGKQAEQQNLLVRIEGLLERSHNLTQRILEQSHRA